MSLFNILGFLPLLSHQTLVLFLSSNCYLNCANKPNLFVFISFSFSFTLLVFNKPDGSKFLFRVLIAARCLSDCLRYTFTLFQTNMYWRQYMQYVKGFFQSIFNTIKKIISNILKKMLKKFNTSNTIGWSI